MSLHLGAAPGDVAPTVLMPGDPLRARWAAEAFLDGCRCITEVRGMLGFSGTWQGHPVTIQGSGMGMASLSIYVNELIRDYGAKTIIRIGSCGALQNDVHLRDVVLAQSASSVSTPSSTLLRELNIAPTADFGLLVAAHAAAQRLGARTHVGVIHSSDTFYDDRTDLTEQLTRHGVLAVEMETAELYLLAARHRARALSCLTVSDHVLTQEDIGQEERRAGFAAMVQIALEAAFA